MSSEDERGFTLVELMVVVALIAILATIAAPMFSDMVAKAQQGTDKGNLAALRSALSIYYSDTEGLFPYDANALTVGGKYLTGVPSLTIPRTAGGPGHPSSGWIANCYMIPGGGPPVMYCNFALGSITKFTAPPKSSMFTVVSFADSFANIINFVGGAAWVYDGSGDLSPNWGQIQISCDHQDLNGRVWYTY